MHDDRSSDGTFSQGAEAVSDRDLLAQFVRRSDERAYAEIVRRHGTLVLGVCRRVLRDRHAAEDAFQATFLVLARSAGRIRRRRSLAGWLHRVAYRVSMRALAESRRRKELAVPMETVSSHDDFTDVEQRYEQQLLDEELQDLPAKYREPLVLHHLQGLSRQQVAERLGMSLTAVDGRLKRGRKQLKMRLLRRGVELGAVLAVVTLGQSAIQAASLEPLFALATQTAAAAHAGSATPSTVSSQAARLAGKELTLMTGSTKLVATLGISAVVVTLIGLAAGDAAAVPGASDRAMLPLLSTVADGVTMDRTGDAPVAQADDQTSYREEPDGATSVDGREVQINELEEWLEQLSRRFAELGSQIRLTSEDDPGQQYEIYNEIGTVSADLERIARQIEDLRSGGDVGDEIGALANRQQILDYSRSDPAVERIEEALDARTTVEFPGNPLNDIIEYLSAVHMIPIMLDAEALSAAGISDDVDIVCVVPGPVRLRNVLDIMLNNVAGVPLDYVVQNEVLTITTRDKADRMLETRVYSLNHLPEDTAELVRSAVEVWMSRERDAAVAGLEPELATLRDLDADPRFQTSVQALPDAIVVTQSQRIHREIVDLLQQLHRHAPESPTSALITAAVNERLDQVTGVAYAEMAWKTIVTAIALDHNLNVVFDEAAIGDRGLTGNEDVTIAVEDVTIRSILKLVLAQVGLTYVVADEVIQVTTPEVATTIEGPVLITDPLNAPTESASDAADNPDPATLKAPVDLSAGRGQSGF